MDLKEFAKQAVSSASFKAGLTPWKSLAHKGVSSAKRVAFDKKQAAKQILGKDVQPHKAKKP